MNTAVHQHHLHFEKPVPTWDEGLPLGNGTLGALVWGDGQPLKISLDRVDLWDLRPIPEYHAPEYTYANMCRWHQESQLEEMVRIFEKPYKRAAPTKIPAGRIEISAGELESSTLDPHAALATTHFAGGASAEVFLHAQRPLGVLRLRGLPQAKFQLCAPAFKPADSAEPGEEIGPYALVQLGYKAANEYSDAHSCSFEQEGWNGYRFAIHMEWREEGDDLVAVWTIAGDEAGEEVLDSARQRVTEALNEGFEALQSSHSKWWRNFWEMSSLSIPDEALERQWYLDMYKFGAAARRGSLPISIQGPWTADEGELPPWKGDYHHDLNTQLCYWPCYSGNHLEEGLGFLDWLWDTRDNCREWTQRFFGVPGLNVPMTADIYNNQIGGWRQYTHSTSTAAWLCHHFYLHWKYSGDDEFLRERAYPYLRECAQFIEAITAERDADGLRSLALSSSPEFHENDLEAWFPTMTNYDVALSRWLLSATAAMAEELEQAEDAEHWRSVQSELPELSTADEGYLLVARDVPLSESHRHFSHVISIHPLGMIAPDNEKGRRIIAASLAQIEELGTKEWTGYSFSWLGIIAARAGDGERAEKALKTFLHFTLPNSFHANGDQSGTGISNFTYRPFTLEGNCAFAAGIQEMLLQSWGGVLRIFPAIPADWRNAKFHSLRGEGAFLVSAEMQNGELVRAEITAERGGFCRVQLPGEPDVREADLQTGEVWNVL